MKLTLSPLRFGFDTYERHRLIAALIDNQAHSHILDVGGTPGLLARFISHHITITNLMVGDVMSNGINLPFKKDSFDIVTSLDVLEHLPGDHRAQFISELIRVSTHQVIFCTPLGSEEHIQREKDLLAFITWKGASNIMLAEHVAFGIPTFKEIPTYLPDNLLSSFIYTGDFRFNGLLFQVDQILANIKIPKFIISLISTILNIIGNLLIYPLTLSSHPHRYTNRVTVVVSKNSFGQ